MSGRAALGIGDRGGNAARAHRSGLIIALVYLALGLLWILGSDAFLLFTGSLTPGTFLDEAVKGSLYVGLSALAVYLLVQYLPARRRWLPALVALAYLALGLTWIVGSDLYLFSAGRLTPEAFWTQLLKGAGFVTISAFVIFLVTRLLGDRAAAGTTAPGVAPEPASGPRIHPLRIAVLFGLILLGLSLILDVYELLVNRQITAATFRGHAIESLLLALFAATTLFLLLRFYVSLAASAARQQAMSDQRYFSLFEHHPDAIYLLDPQGRFRDANPALSRLFGRSRDGLIGRSWEELAAPEDLDYVRERFTAALDGEPQSYEARGRGPDGGSVWLQVTNIPQYEDGQITGVFGIARDTTAQKTAQERIAASETRFRALFEHSLDAVFLTRPDGTIEAANPAAESMLRLSEQEIIRRGRQGLVEDDEALKMHLAERARTGRARGVIHYKRDDGTTFPAEITSALFEDGEGATRAFVVAHDISDRVQREEELRASEAAYRRFYEQHPDAVFVVDLDGRIAEVNEAATDLLDMSGKEMVGKVFDPLVWPDDLAMAWDYFQRVSAGGTVSFRMRLRRKNGDCLWAQYVAFPRLEHGTPTGVIGIARDVDAEHRAQQKLAESEARYRNLFEHSTDAILVSNPEGEIFEANPAAEQLFGLSAEEFRRLGRAGLVDEDEPARIKLLEDRLEHGKARAEIHMRRGDGSWILVDISTVGFTDINGEERTSVVIRDITETRRQQVALEQSEERLRATVESSLDPIIGMDADGRIIQFNQAAEHCFGLDRGDVLDEPLDEHLMPERFREAHARGLKRYLETGEATMLGTRAEVTGLRASGEEFPAELTINVTKGPSGTIFVGYMRDVTEQRRQEQALRESEERFRAIVEHSPDPILTLDPEAGRILSANAEAERLFGWNETQFRRLERAEHTDADAPAFRRFLEERRATGHARAMLTMYRADGTSFPADVTSATYENSAGERRAVAMVRDITEQREREELLRESEDRYRSLYEQSMDAILVSDPEDASVLGANEAAQALFGLDEETLRARPTAEWMDPEDPDTREYLETRRREGQARARIPMRRGDGTWFTADLTSRLYQDARGRWLANSIVRDMTEEEAYERQLEESEERFRIVADNTGQAIYEIRLDTGRTSWAGACRDIFGFEPRDLGTLSDEERLARVPESDRDRVAQAYREAASAGGSFNLEYPLITRDGNRILVEDWGIVLQERGCMYGVIQDVTEKRRLVRHLEEREQALSELSQVQQAILDALPAHIALLNDEGAVQYVNAAWRRFARENEFVGSEAGVGSNYLAVCDAARGRDAGIARETARGIRQVMAGERPLFDAEYPCHGPEERRWFRMSVTPFRSGEAGGAVVAHVDVSDRREAERQLELVAAAFRSADEAMLLCDSDFVILDTNEAFTRLTGRERDDAIGNRPMFLDIEQQERHIRQALQAEGHWRGELLQRRMDGRMFVARAAVSEVQVPDAGHPYLVVNFEDISALRDFERKIDYLSYHDPLTGLPNRVALEEWFRNLETAGEAGTMPELAFVFIDLDRLKTVNDAFGHAVGDELIQELARRLRKVCEGDDYVARLLGDEFVMVVGGVADGEEAIEIVRHRMEMLVVPFQLDQAKIYPTVCAGIALSPEHGTHLEELLRKADVAMHQAKSRGRGELVVFSAEMTDEVEEQLLIERNLRDGIDNREFLLHYQPSVLLDSGRIIGVEALVRWENPKLGLVPPDRFIPVAEDSGLIIDLGDWVFEEVCRQIGEWQSQDVPFGWIAVNLSPMQFQDLNLLSKIRAMMEKYGVSGEQIRVEITENVLVMDPDWTTRVLENLRELGIRVAVDDFGTGYSSLAYLKRFPVDFVKLDKTFVAGLPEDETDASIVASVVSLAKQLGMGVVGEGIERDEQRCFLMEAGCLEAQGYFFSLPLRTIDLPWLLKSHQTLPVGKPAGDAVGSTGIG